MQTQCNDVIVIGGGMAGLAAACYLARAGLKVTLYEKAQSLGGRAATQVHNGYHFNRGGHALYTGGPATDVLRELGVSYSGQSPKGIGVLHEGKISLAPISALTLFRTDFLGFADKLELMRVFMTLPQIRPEEWEGVSVRQWLDRNFHQPRLKLLMEANARTSCYTTRLDLVSANVFIKRLQITANNPILYIDGGWQSLVEGLRRNAEQAGVKIVSGARVEQVEAHGVRLHDGQTVNTSAVIVATHPHDVAKLIPAMKPTLDALIPAQVACLDVALSRLPNSRYPVVQDLDNPRFITAQSQFARLAPDGGTVIHTFKQLDPTKPSDPREDERDLENLLDTVQPGWREVVVKRFFMPRMDAVGALPMVKNGRPAVEAACMEGVYLAGDWVGTEGFLVDASLASARQAAQSVLKGELVMAV